MGFFLEVTLMHRRILALAGLSLVTLVKPLNAQRPVFVNVAGGVSLPMGRFADGANTGWHALASLGVSTFMQPIGLRLDAAYNNFTAKIAGPPDQAVTSATLNLTYRLPMTNSPISPYLITGAGVYRFECVGGVDCGTTTRFGWNAGLGFKLAGLGHTWFLESRFHAVNARAGNVRFVPITFGLTL
jgi:opacity protein-like surface antigen